MILSLDFSSDCGILFVLRVRETKEETKNIMNYDDIKWTSYKQQQDELAREAELANHDKHIFVCNLIIAACAGASVVLIGILFPLAPN